MAKMLVKRKAKPRPKKPAPFIGCTIKALSAAKGERAARHAIADYPANAPANPHTLDVAQLVAYTTQYWGPGDRIFATQFLDTTSKPLIDRILLHMNAWAEFTNKSFQYVARDGEVRVALGTEGYWSYLGQTILQIARTQPTMGLEKFSINHSEAEYRRVVRHETGHSLGFQHGQLLPATIQRLDRAKTIAWFQRYYGWGEAQTVQNVLTPLDTSQAVGSFEEDADSVMTYMIPPECFKDGKGLVGGIDITNRDRRDGSRLYPPKKAPPPVQGYPGDVYACEETGKVWWWNESGILIERKPMPLLVPLNVAANRKFVVVGAGKGAGPAGIIYDYATGNITWTAYVPGFPESWWGGVVPWIRPEGGQVSWSGMGGLVVEMDPSNGRVIGSEVRNAPVPKGHNYKRLIV